MALGEARLHGAEVGRRLREPALLDADAQALGQRRRGAGRLAAGLDGAREVLLRAGVVAQELGTPRRVVEEVGLGLAVLRSLRALDVELLGVLVVLAPEFRAADREEEVVPLALELGQGEAEDVDRSIEVPGVALALPDENEILRREAVDPVHAVEAGGHALGGVVGEGAAAQEPKAVGHRRLVPAGQAGRDGAALQVAQHGRARPFPRASRPSSARAAASRFSVRNAVRSSSADCRYVAFGNSRTSVSRSRAASSFLPSAWAACAA